MDYIIANDGIFVDRKRYQEKMSKNIEIVSMYNNIDTGMMKAKIEFDTPFDRKEKNVERSDYLSKRGLLKLQADGMDVTQKNCDDLIEYLTQAEEEAEKEFLHSKLGFGVYKSKEIYKLHKAIGVDSKYDGAYQIQPKGSKDKYMEMIEKEVLGNPKLELAWVSGLSAILLGYIGEEISADTLIMHLVGNSTTGKSTALKLAISCFSAPDNKKESLYGTYNGTDNALISKLTGLNGVPYALDELSMSNSDNFSTFIYKVANGADKDRLDKNSDLKKRGTWLTTILSNGEKSILNSSDKNAGIQVRVLEFENITWTNDAQNAENINEVIMNNYGHIGLIFAKLIMDKGKGNLIEEFKKVKKDFEVKLCGNMNSDSMLTRRTSKYAIILQTVKLVEELIDKSLDSCNIEKLLIDVEKNSIRNRNFKTTLIEHIKQYITKNSNRFVSEEDNTVIGTGQVLGEIKVVKGKKELQMDKISFENMLKEGGFQDSKVALKELKKEGLLSADSDRYTRGRKNKFGITTQYIVVRIDEL